MTVPRSAALRCLLALVLAGCPGPSTDKCKNVTCPTSQSCDPANGMCVIGGVGGGSGGGGVGGGSGGGRVDAGPPPLALSQACQKIGEAKCDFLIRCGYWDMSERAACIGIELDNCQYARNANAGLTQYDGVAAAECILSYAQGCGHTTLPARCADVAPVGRGAAGAPCDDFDQCQEDAGVYCNYFTTARCSQCTRYAGPGGFCSYDTDVNCADNLNCYEPDGDGGVCVAPGLPGAICDFDRTCQTDAGFCPPSPGDGGERVCQPLAAAGQRCNTNSNCVTGNFCSSPGDGGSALCEMKHGNGGPCTSTTQCQMGLYCPGGTGIRNCTPLLVDGSPCTIAATCAANYCNRDIDPAIDAGIQRCGYLLIGEECYDDGDCGPGNVCNGWIYVRPDAGAVPGACAAKDPDGGTCTNSATLTADSCANPRASCLGGRCVETPPYSQMAGQDCDNYRQCGGESHCDWANPITWDGHCTTTRLVDGEVCREDPACMLGSYCHKEFSGQLEGVCMKIAHRDEPCDDTNGPYCSSYPALLCGSNPDGGADTLCVPSVGPGQPCNENFGPYCYSSYCDADAGACAPRQQNGATCDFGAQCSSNTCQNPDGGFDDRSCVMACF